MTDYTEVNEKFQKFIDENGLGDKFKFTGDHDIWEITECYHSIKFPIHNKSRTLKDLIYIAFQCGRQQGNYEQQKRTVKRFENLISPRYDETIWI